MTWAARLIERYADEFLLRSEGATVQRWLSVLPAELATSRPRLLLAKAWLDGLGGRGAATAMFALGTGIALIDLLVKDTSGDTGLPPLLGWAGMLPCLAGLLTVTLLWRRS